MGANALMNVKLQGKLLNLNLKHSQRTAENQFHNFFLADGGAGEWKSAVCRRISLQKSVSLLQVSCLLGETVDGATVWQKEFTEGCD